MQATPATWQLLLSTNLKFPPVRALIGGDALPGSLVEKLVGIIGCSVWNLYGPTETTIWSAIYQPRPETNTTSWVPIGGAIANTEIHILDKRMERCPVGIAGEVYIGGEGLARGYWNKPELTADRFVPDPFSSTAGLRLYCTGDVGVRRPSGAIEFLGRNDHQVKIRGFRIELGEIEAVLRQYPGIGECAISVRDEHRDKRLVAYLVSTAGREPAANELRSYARACLPEYMVPGEFVFLDKLPLTPNGKLDRKALAALRPVSSSAVEHTAPQSELERTVGRIWQTVLGREIVGTDDNFFDLGGHSLLLTQVQNQLHQFNHRVSMVNLFQFPTVRSLTNFISGTQQDSNPDAHGAIQRAPRGHDQVLPLSFAQRRLWLIDEIRPGNRAYSLTVAARIRGNFDLALLRTALAGLVARHEGLRTVFYSVDGIAAQKVRPEQPIELELIEQSHLPEVEWDGSVVDAAQECSNSFDLMTGPLFRLKLLKFSQENHALVACLHHIIADGWSLGLILRDLSELYESSATGRASSLPQLVVQPVDYAVWQQQRWASGALQPQVDFWLNELENVPSFLNLPSDWPRLTAPGFAGHHEFFELSGPVSEALHRLCREKRVTPFMALLATFSLMLGRYSGQDDFVIGTDIANRNHVTIENLVGCFVNLLPLRMKLNDDLSFFDYLNQVKDQSLAAFANQDVPFDHLIRILRPERKMTNTPLVQVLFVLQNAPLEAIETENIRWEPFPVPMTTAEFELILSMRETEGLFTGMLALSLDLFTPDKAEVMVKHLKALLGQVLTHPERPLSSFSLLDDAEKLKKIVDQYPDLELNQKDLDSLLMQIDPV